MWKNGQMELDPSRFSPALAFLLERAMERAAARELGLVTEGDILYCLLPRRADETDLLALPVEERTALSDAAALAQRNLNDGVRVRDCLNAFDVVAVRGDGSINPFLRESWRDPLPELIEDMPDGAGPNALLERLFRGTERLKDGDLLTSLFRRDALLDALSRADARRELFTADGALAGESLLGRARFLIERAGALAAMSGGETVEPLHLLAAMLTFRESYTNLLVGRLSPGSSTRVMNYLNGLFSDRPGAKPLRSNRENFSPALVQALEAAAAQTASVGLEKTGERELFLALMDTRDAKARYLLDEVLSADPAGLRALADEIEEPEVIEPRLPLDVGECRNLSLGDRKLEGRDDLIRAVMKVFFRKDRRNALLHGDSGVGMTTLPELLARELKSGRYSALSQTQVIYVDLGAIAMEEYEAAAERLLAFMERENGRIYAVEGFGRYLREHFAACARRFSRNEYRLMLLVNTADYTALQGMNEPVAGFLEPIAVSEPTRDQTAAMVELALPALEAEYGVSFQKGASAAATRMATDYLLSRRFPKKVIELLADTAADVAAEAEMGVSDRRLVTREQVARRLSEQIGLPVETILGTGADKDYAGMLSANLVGQDAAVSKVAGRLDLIQKGMVDKKAPAAVFVFAGLSGTGKTELAKQIAQIYSSSRRLITFEMVNFGESHSVSRLIGTPPGYVGYEEGGKLINDLNRDPYSVVLLDEIEKAHPAVWDPFMNLFDEGWITDMRGVTASGSKAFFVLTSNIGQYEITRMLREGRPAEEIEDVVMKQFTKELHYKTHDPCFRPEFIGRIMRRGGIVVFNALSLEAMKAITRLMARKIAKDFAEVYSSRLIIDDDVLDMIAQTIYEENEEVIRARSGGYFGGRRLDIMLDQFVKNKLAVRIRHLAGAPMVRVVLSGRDTEVIPVYQDADAEALLAERHLALVDRVNRRFDRLISLPEGAFDALDDDRLARLDALLSEVNSLS